MNKAPPPRRGRNRLLALANRHPRRRVNLALLRRVARTALAWGSSRPVAELSICLVDASAMTTLNRQFLNHDGSTDVITFAYRQDPLQAEICISLDDARRQARQFHTTWQTELVRYLVHGLLHLEGFDDQTPADRQRMKRAEDGLVRRLRARFTLSRLAPPTMLRP